MITVQKKKGKEKGKEKRRKKKKDTLRKEPSEITCPCGA